MAGHQQSILPVAPFDNVSNSCWCHVGESGVDDGD